MSLDCCRFTYINQTTVMNIKIKVINSFTNEVEIDSQIEVTSDWKTVQNNHSIFRGAFPNCQVNFFIDDNNFIYSPALNMERDEQEYDKGRMTWNAYINKWYKECPAMCNEEEDIIERYKAEDFASRDAVCQ